MFITNIRYGELPVRKVYLGEKLVWQCLDMHGSADSSSYTEATFYMSAAASLVGNAQSLLRNEAITSILKISVMMSEMESKSYTNSLVKLIETLPMLGDGKSESYNNSIGSVLDVIRMGGFSDIELDDAAMNRLISAYELSSDIDMQFYNVGGCSSQIPEAVNGKIIINSNGDAAGNTPSEEKIGGNVMSYLTTKSVAGCIIPYKVKAFSESDSYGSAIGNIFDVMTIGGSASTNNTAEAAMMLADLLTMIGDEKHYTSTDVMCQLFKLLQIKCDGGSKSDAKALTVLRRPIQGLGNSESKTYSDSFINKHFLIECMSKIEYDSYGSAQVALWYPPIGDEIPLVESDGIDIAVDGNTLEIIQAYQINIDSENRILEVI